MATALERYKALLRDELAPALRSRGFKGSGTRYELPDPTHWLLVGFQSSKWSSADAVRFTVNLFVADKSEWAALAAEQGYPSRPSPNIWYSSGLGPLRLARLAFGRDDWWEVSSERSVAATVESVLGALDAHGIPWLQARVPRTV